MREGENQRGRWPATLSRTAAFAFLLGAVVPLALLGIIVQSGTVRLPAGIAGSAVVVVLGVGLLTLASFLLLRRAAHHSQSRIDATDLQLESLRSASSSLVNAQHENDVVGTAARTALEVTGAIASLVFLRPAADAALKLAEAAGLGDALADAALEELEEWLELALESGRPALYAGGDLAPGGRVAAAAIAPLKGSSGVLLALHTEPGLTFEAAHLGGLCALADLASLALPGAARSNAELHRQIYRRTRAEERARELESCDAVTGLPSRQVFRDALEDAITHLPEEGRVAALFVSLDGFKEINESFGHPIGDQLLRRVGERLLGCVRIADSVGVGRDPSPDDSAPSPAEVSRVAGDEFTVLLSSIRSVHDAAQVAQRVLKVLAEPFQTDGREVFTGGSIGIAVFPDDGADADSILRKAELAMYRAKQGGRGTYQCFAESMNDEVARRLRLANDLRSAIPRDQFRLVYQPQFDTETGEVLAAEALIRWHHPDLGLVMPGEFIEIAEQSGYIVRLGEWTLQHACREARAWQRPGRPPVRVAVNVSAQQLCGGNLTERVKEALDDGGIGPECLELEITENATLSDEGEALEVLGRIKAMGVRIALDDFGTGYSPLTYVKSLPVDALKIDRCFVSEIGSSAAAEAISKAIIGMAHGLNLLVVAEGVETEAQRDFLKEHRCDLLQGFLLGVPAPPEELRAALEGADSADA